MTPQLQQAIKLLQLSTIELQQEIQEALDANPLLEAEDEYDSFNADSNNKEHDHSQQEGASDDNTEIAEPDTSEAMSEQNISEDLPLDNNWDDLVSAAPVSAGNNGSDEDTVYQGETSETLQDYLRWQMELTPFSATDRAIAEIIIEAVDETGLLTISCEDILESLQLPDVEADEVEAFVAAYTTDNAPSRAPHQILHLWLTETLVPRYLSPPVFQALARYCMRAQLQEAAQAPL